MTDARELFRDNCTLERGDAKWRAGDDDWERNASGTGGGVCACAVEYCRSPALLWTVRMGRCMRGAESCSTNGSSRHSVLSNGGACEGYRMVEERVAIGRGSMAAVGYTLLDADRAGRATGARGESSDMACKLDATTGTA